MILVIIIRKDEMKYIKITRNDVDGSYIVPKEQLTNVIDGEVVENLDYVEPGTEVTLTIVEMTKQEYEKLDEFEGW
jgi:hypothetical protein